MLGMQLPTLADPEDLALRLGCPVGDGKLLLALNRASGRFRGAVGHPVSLVQSDTVLLGGDGGATLLLPAAPVANVTVRICGEVVDGVQVSSRSGVLRLDGGWPDGLDNIEITYDHGFAVIPADIQDAVLEQAELQYSVMVAAQQVTQGGRSVTFGTQATVGVTQRWQECVDRYRVGADAP